MSLPPPAYLLLAPVAWMGVEWLVLHLLAGHALRVNDRRTLAEAEHARLPNHSTGDARDTTQR
jgi:hypothetical protein